MLRTFDYIEAYSLTRLRIAALIWMGLVAIGLVLICYRLLRGRSGAWLINANLLAALLVLGACCTVDLGRMAAAWNVRHARETGGAGAALDLCYLNELGASALLPLIELERRPICRPSCASGSIWLRSPDDGRARREPGRLARLDLARRRPPRRRPASSPTHRRPRRAPHCDADGRAHRPPLSTAAPRRRPADAKPLTAPAER